MQKQDTSVDFLNFHLENPFLLAASPVARTAEMIGRAFEMGWGGAVTKSVSLDQDERDHGLSPRFTGVRAGGTVTETSMNIQGMTNIDFRIDNSVADTMNDFALVKKKYPHKFLALSIKAQFVQEHWKRLGELASDTGADALELCLSCPDTPSGGGVCMGSIGQNPEGIKTVLSWVREVSDLPVMVKLTSHVQSLPSIGLAVQDGGGAALSAVNTLKCIPGIDFETLLPVPTIEGASTSTGLSGSTIKPLAQYCVYELCKTEGLDLPVSGVGGVSCSRDALEYLLLGATNVQVATAIMQEGYRIIDDLLFGLQDFMEWKGFRRIEDFRGSLLSKYVPSTAGLSRRQQLASNINEELCTRCGRCFISCRDGAYQAIDMDENRHLSVDQEKCVGCGLCDLVCPVPGAIFFTRKEDWV